MNIFLWVLANRSFYINQVLSRIDSHVGGMQDSHIRGMQVPQTWYLISNETGHGVGYQ